MTNPGDVATISFFADDSNDKTFQTSESNPLFDFSIQMSAAGASPTLTASFTYDPSRLCIPGALTDPSQFQAYANYLLCELLADTAAVSLTSVGSLGETLSINNPVTLFTGTYTASISSPGCGSELSQRP